MKKVFIGCGIIVLIALLFVGYIAYSIWPNAMQMQHAWVAATDELNALDKQYPFDPKTQTQLDPARFGLMLDARVALADYFTDLEQQMDAMTKAQSEDGSPGWIDTLRQAVDRIAPVPTEIAAQLKNAGMGPQEFAWYTRVLWATLARVDENLAGKDLEELRGRYGQFEERYEAERREQSSLAPLRDLTAGLPPDALITAEQVLAQDLGRAKHALSITEVDYLYLQSPLRFEEVEHIEPLKPGAQVEAEPATAPAQAPPAEPTPVEPAPAEPAPR